jgi:aspartate aminotransferase
MLESAGVGVVPGEAFGAPGYIRISLARPRKELVAGISKIAAFLAREVRK